jgi:hypothetical protein
VPVKPRKKDDNVSSVKSVEFYFEEYIEAIHRTSVDRLSSGSILGEEPLHSSYLIESLS